jgi:PKD repeat protein
MSLKKTQTRKLVLSHPKNESLFKLTATVVFGLTVLLSSFGNTAQAQGCSGFDAGFTISQHDSYLAGPEARFINTNRSKRYNYKWYMGDGTVITDSTDRYRPSSDTTYRYKNYGKYQVCHVVESRNCYDSTCKMVNITCDTTINFGVYQVFINNLKYGFYTRQSADSFVWKSGDGTKQTGTADFTHTYSKPGSYKVTLKAFKGPNNNCVATEQRTINACDADATFYASQGNDYRVSFYPDDTAANSYSWDFGDGSTSTKAKPTHAYSNTGTYQVTLIAKGSSCVDTQTRLVDVRCKAYAGYIKSSGKSYQRTFSSRSSNGNSYSWNFGDGTTSKKANPTHTYGKPGTYQVTLIVKDSMCADTQTKQVTIRCKPDASFRVQGNKFQRTFKPDTTANSYSWDFGDGSTSTKRNPTHTYSDTGTYKVTLIANSSNCADTQTKQVTIIAPIPKQNR